jgi:peptidoglycan/LPS O-acetylase OafA/YrhL
MAGTCTTMSKSSIALCNLRAVIIVIVVAFHSLLAYLASTPAGGAAFDQAPYSWEAFPIVDAQRWLGFDLFCAWQDVSLMSLLFFLSGLLAAGSLTRKGSRTYIADRLWRIGLPFLLAVAFLSPLSFYPAYLVRTAEPSVLGFWRQWFSLSSWPSGPQWFLWQLLVVNVLAAALYAVAPGYIQRLGRLAAWIGERPVIFFAFMAAASALAYVPLALIYSPWTWGAFGPLALQFCRPAHYVVYFFIGLALGNYGLDRGLVACDGPLARNWLAFLAAAVVSFGVWAGFTSLTMPDWDKAAGAAQLAASLAFPLACAGGGLFLLAVCLRFGRNRRWVLDSLSANAYSIYLLHYVFVVWLQYALLDSGLLVFVKAAIVFTGALIVSWAASVGFARLLAGSRLVAARRAISPMSR